MEVDIVLGGHLLDRTAAHIGLRLVVADDQLDRPAENSTLLVDAVDRHLHPDEGRLAAISGEPGQRLHGTKLVGLAFAKSTSPWRRQDRRSERDASACCS